ncbi:MAG TPA: YbhB/YbcL family Raf kinase inhibitor-like protein [Candidatus Paceibacterota bacterium]
MAQQQKTIIVLIALSIALFIFIKGSGILSLYTINNSVGKGIMRIESTTFKHSESVPKKFTCDGENINPELSIGDVPEGTKSLALIVDDPDAPVGLWVHWVVWNISPETKTIKEHSVPKGAMEGATSAGKPGYRGPCPPDGEHRYFFKLYALDTEINLPPDADKDALEEEMVGHVLDKAELIGLYSR